MASKVRCSPLVDTDIDGLATALHHEAVYEFIGGLQSRADFDLWLHRAIAGPPSKTPGEIWLNYAVRSADDESLIGRLEACIHDDLAEVAFLTKPSLWGRGYASAGLVWLQEHLRHHWNVGSIWASAHPENVRSAALLRKCGFVEALAHDLPALRSYDEGDVVFRHGLR